MSHLETLIFEYLEWRGFLLRKNVKVGRRVRGGWEMELDIVGYNPKSGALVHYEPSLDALPWPKREMRYKKKFEAAQKYLFTEIFPLVAAHDSHSANRGICKSSEEQGHHRWRTNCFSGRTNG